MHFENIKIIHFRNFETLDIKLDNKNVIFGLNDVGKTNFLNAIRAVFDYKFRNSINEKDFFEMDFHNPIDIIVSLSLDADEDDHFLIANLKGALHDNVLHPNIIKIRLKISWDEKQRDTIIEMFWGNNDNPTELSIIPTRGISRTEIDNLFSPVYMEPLNDGVKDFQRSRNSLLSLFEESDPTLTEQIQVKNAEINELLSKSDIVTGLQKNLTNEYSDLRDEHSKIVLNSEQQIGRLSTGLKPYVQLENNSSLYPSSGDGRKKILSYAIKNLLAKKSEQQKIIIHLIEEPENSLHKSLQKSLSRKIFNPNDPNFYKYIFLTTHSSEIVSEMDDTMLIRLGLSNSHSTMFTVPNNFKNIRKMYSEQVSEAIFYNKVFLVEGPSEKILFESILSINNVFIEEQGGYILNIRGIGFKPYFNLLRSIGINVFVRTDNDAKPNKSGEQYYKFTGVKRLIDLFNDNNHVLQHTQEWSQGLHYNCVVEDLEHQKNLIYNSQDINSLRTQNLFISKNDLENDMLLTSSDSIINDLKNERLTSTADVVNYLQSSKQKNMVEFVKVMSNTTSQKLYDNLDGLKEFVDAN
ncbi:AAA family ATPase [Leuconostoc gelidum subsp. aenigmaticum]|uniref:ATP-dependent nuclease n=1 Tax=Leuconostoc gelidum TaxID=1244 RepID=UPI001CC7E2FA|nr:AAA family ATPase [Leuconostoc gelidum]MBZ6009324.1 AAA family ATPase [Leuconostoc gelidum subsp. aenigmaticum]